jgi:hypothetical protein
MRIPGLLVMLALAIAHSPTPGHVGKIMTADAEGELGNCGDLVIERDGRHIRRVEAILHGAFVRV